MCPEEVKQSSVRWSPIAWPGHPLVLGCPTSVLTSAASVVGLLLSAILKGTQLTLT